MQFGIVSPFYPFLRTEFQNAERCNDGLLGLPGPPRPLRRPWRSSIPVVRNQGSDCPLGLAGLERPDSRAHRVRNQLRHDAPPTLTFAVGQRQHATG